MGRSRAGGAMDVLKDVLRVDWRSSGLSQGDRRRLLDAAEWALALRVEERLEEHAGEQRMEEFDTLYEPRAAERWLRAQSPRFRSHGDYRQLERLQRDRFGTVDRDRLLVEYAMMRWIDRWFPGFDETIETEMLVLRAELLSQREVLLHLAR